jgi:hypothetical protein
MAPRYSKAGLLWLLREINNVSSDLLVGNETEYLPLGFL